MNEVRVKGHKYTVCIETDHSDDLREVRRLHVRMMQGAQPTIHQHGIWVPGGGGTVVPSDEHGAFVGVGVPRQHQVYTSAVQQRHDALLHVTLILVQVTVLRALHSTHAWNVMT